MRLGPRRALPCPEPPCKHMAPPSALSKGGGMVCASLCDRGRKSASTFTLEGSKCAQGYLLKGWPAS